VLFGKVDPGGKLAMSVPRDVGQIPISDNELPAGRPFDPDNKVRGHGDLLSAEHCPARGVRSPRGSRWRGSSNRSSRVRPVAATMSSMSRPGWQLSSTRSVPCVTGGDGFLSPWTWLPSTGH
jgi:hypothetical protein